MREGNCPKCGSKEIYTSDSSYLEAINVKSTTPSLEMSVSDISIALFREGRTLKKSLPASSNWAKV